eukprot:scaffold64_cov248-Pinguiococcus_pyrenoidosus.AAC.4
MPGASASVQLEDVLVALRRCRLEKHRREEVVRVQQHLPPHGESGDDAGAVASLVEQHCTTVVARKGCAGGFVQIARTLLDAAPLTGVVRGTAAVAPLPVEAVAGAQKLGGTVADAAAEVAGTDVGAHAGAAGVTVVSSDLHLRSACGETPVQLKQRLVSHVHHERHDGGVVDPVLTQSAGHAHRHLANIKMRQRFQSALHLRRSDAAQVQWRRETAFVLQHQGTLAADARAATHALLRAERHTRFHTTRRHQRASLHQKRRQISGVVQKVDRRHHFAGAADCGATGKTRGDRRRREATGEASDAIQVHDRCCHFCRAGVMWDGVRAFAAELQSQSAAAGGGASARELDALIPRRSGHSRVEALEAEALRAVVGVERKVTYAAEDALRIPNAGVSGAVVQRAAVAQLRRLLQSHAAAVATAHGASDAIARTGQPLAGATLKAAATYALSAQGVALAHATAFDLWATSGSFSCCVKDEAQITSVSRLATSLSTSVVCAVSSALKSPSHASPFGQLRREQSAPATHHSEGLRLSNLPRSCW